jgi:membrane-associated phospholipid phosphatase
MLTFANYLGAHFVQMLLLAIAALWILIASFWMLIHRYGNPLQQGAAGLWKVATGSRAAGALRRIPYVAGSATRAVALVRYFGLHAILGFTVAIAAFAFFVELADEIGLDEDLALFDEALAASLRQHLSGDVLRSFATVTHLGDFHFMLALGAVITIALCIRRRWHLAAAWVTATALGGVLNVVLKSLFERARPLHDHGFAHAEGWSFPSGHASGSMIVYGLLGYLLVRHVRRTWHVPIALITASLIVIVGSSRVILQVHFFSDVLAGYASAAAWLAMWVAGLEAARWRARRGQLSEIIPS